MFELINGIRSMLEAVEAIKSGQKALIITDDEGESIWKGQLIKHIIDSMGAEAVMTIITPRKHVAEEPPDAVAAAMKNVDVVLFAADSGNLVHTTARKEATASGIKFYSIFQIPLEDLKQGVSSSDIKLIKERTEALAERLTHAKLARITTSLGTDITLSLADRKAIPFNPMSHIVSSLPYFAEAAIAPVEGTAEGIILADLEVVDWGYLFREPIKFTVKAGRVVDIAGSNEDADRLRKIAATDENATNIAELGIGTSHIIPWPMHGTRRDAARIGTAHIAIGRNDDIGGNTYSSIHEDNLMSLVTIELDDQYVLKEGELLV